MIVKLDEKWLCEEGDLGGSTNPMSSNMMLCYAIKDDVVLRIMVLEFEDCDSYRCLMAMFDSSKDSILHKHRVLFFCPYI